MREGEVDVDRESESEKQTESVCERVQTKRERNGMEERDTIEKQIQITIMIQQ